MFRTSKCLSSGWLLYAVLWHCFHAEIILKCCMNYLSIKCSKHVEDTVFKLKHKCKKCHLLVLIAYFSRSLFGCSEYMTRPWDVLWNVDLLCQTSRSWERISLVEARSNAMAHAQETRFRLSAKRTGPFKSAGASVPSTRSRCVRISGSNAGYTMFRGSVKSTGYPLHSPVSPLQFPSRASPCAITFQLEFICIRVFVRGSS
jgi:hypothetical protein